MGEINKTDELKHWGVLGMRWGVRKSKKQLAKENNKKKGKLEKEEETFKTTKKKSLSKLTDDEVSKETNRRKLENALQKEKLESLRNEVTRMQLEQQYATLNPPKQSFLTKMWNDIWPRAKNATLNAGEKLLEDALVDKGKDLLGLKTESLDDKKKKLEIQKLEKDLNRDDSVDTAIKNEKLRADKIKNDKAEYDFKQQQSKNKNDTNSKEQNVRKDVNDSVKNWSPKITDPRYRLPNIKKKKKK